MHSQSEGVGVIWHINSPSIPEENNFVQKLRVWQSFWKDADSSEWLATTGGRSGPAPFSLLGGLRPNESESGECRDSSPTLQCKLFCNFTSAGCLYKTPFWTFIYPVTLNSVYWFVKRAHILQMGIENGLFHAFKVMAFWFMGRENWHTQIRYPKHLTWSAHSLKLTVLFYVV